MDNDGIPFFCTFDYLGKGLPVYTFKTTCKEDTAIALEDGITKIIINSKAAAQEKNAKLKVFLEYMNGKVSDDEFIQRLERRIQEVKANEQLRREYMLVNTIERDARNDGWKTGLAKGLAEGSRQKALETAKTMLTMGYPLADICKIAGLSSAEVEALK